MSLDNGIYILKCKDQYRVAHVSVTGILRWSYLSNSVTEEYVPTRLYELYRNCKFTRKKSLALFIASKMLEDLEVCEHGIKIIQYHGTWDQLVEAAKELATSELESIGDGICGEETYKTLVELAMEKMPDEADLASVTQYSARITYSKESNNER